MADIRKDQMVNPVDAGEPEVFVDIAGVERSRPVNANTDRMDSESRSQVLEEGELPGFGDKMSTDETPRSTTDRPTRNTNEMIDSSNRSDKTDL